MAPDPTGSGAIAASHTAGDASDSGGRQLSRRNFVFFTLIGAGSLFVGRVDGAGATAVMTSTTLLTSATRTTGG